MKLLIIIMLLCLNSNISSAAQEKDIHQVTLGTGIKWVDAGQQTLSAIDIPFLGQGIGNEYIRLSIHEHNLWGISKSKFFYDPSIAVGLRLTYREIVSARMTGHLGSFFLNNVTLMGECGIDLGVPVTTEGDLTGIVFIGCNLFYRKVYELLGYMKGDHWYNSGKGYGVCIGVRVKK